MPDAEYLDWQKYPQYINQLKEILAQYFANTDSPTRFTRSPEANELWKKLYCQLNDQKYVSFIDGVLVRDTSHLLKLALIYAVLDQAAEIQVQHLQAALAICDYSQASLRWLFSERTGNRTANKIFWALVREPDGMSREQIQIEVLHKNTPKTELDEALEALAKNGIAGLEIRLSEKEHKSEFWFAKNT